jgi:hypothetical protein
MSRPIIYLIIADCPSRYIKRSLILVAQTLFFSLHVSTSSSLILARLTLFFSLYLSVSPSLCLSVPNNPELSLDFTSGVVKSFALQAVLSSMTRRGDVWLLREDPELSLDFSIFFVFLRLDFLLFFFF